MNKSQQANIAAIIQAEADMLGAWEGKLRSIWGEGSRFDLFREAVADKSDAFHYLQSAISQQPEHEREIIVSRSIDRIQSEAFLIADLFTEVRLLAELLEDGFFFNAESEDSEGGQLSGAREILWDFYELVARETSVFYETFAEQGSQALVFLDRDGHVTYANLSARKLLGETESDFGRFDSRLSDEDRLRFEAMLQRLESDLVKSPGLMTLRLEIDGKLRDIGVEAAHLGRESGRSAYYLSLSTHQFIGVEDDKLELFDHGVIRVDADNNIVYANDAARRVIGLSEEDSALPRHVHDFFEEGKDRDQIDQELLNRKVGNLSHYKINAIRTTGRKVPISVFAIPETNLLGHHTGSIAFITNLEVEQATEDFNRILLDSMTWKERLEGLCRWLFQRFDADIIGVAQYTDDLKHSSSVATLENDGREFKVQRRWYDLSPGLIRWLEQPEIKREGNLPEFMERDYVKYLKEDPTVNYLVEHRKMRSFMATPILQDDVYKAGISFISTEFDKFSQDDAELLERLPLKNFIMSALERKDNELKAFQARLLLELVKCESFLQIADKVTLELAEFFKWDNVSIFDVAEDLGRMILLGQKPGSERNYLLPEDFDQHHNVGLLGRAVRKKKVVYVPDVDKDDNFVRWHPDTKSELVIPIYSKLYEPKRVFWLLNIEDCMESFLLKSEIEMLKDIATQIEFVVNHMIDRETYASALTKTSDGVIITDANGSIRYANPKACELLDCEADLELTGKKIERLFRDKQLAENFKSGKLTDSHKVELLRKGDADKPFSVLMSRLEMSERISDKYYLFKSLESQKRLADLDAVERLVSVAANQVKTPLGLAQGMLHRLAHGNHQLDPEKIASFVDRTRSLLKKAELSYDRVAYSDSIVSTDNRIDSHVHLDRIIGSLNEELSGGLSTIINLAVEGKERPVSADRHQIRFVFESLISYLLRNVESGGQIEIVLKFGRKQVEVFLDAVTERRNKAETDPDDTDWDRAISEASLGQSVIRRIVAQHDGEYRGPLIDGETGELGFEIRLPTI